MSTPQILLAGVALLAFTVVGCADGDSTDATGSPETNEPAAATKQLEQRSSAVPVKPRRESAKAKVVLPAPAGAAPAGTSVRNRRGRARLLGLLRGASDGQARAARQVEPASPEARMLLDRLRRRSAQRPSPRPREKGRIEQFLADLRSRGG